MNPIENNKIIALFMGARFISDGCNSPTSKDIFIPIHGNCRIDTIELGKGKIIQYHNSWDWLMPVVEKIESTELRIKGGSNYPDFDIFSTGINVAIPGLLEIANIPNEQYVELGKMKSVYNACIEFIKWYNTQKH